MSLLVSLTIGASALLLGLLALVLLIEVLAAIVRRPSNLVTSRPGHRPRVAVLIPAHNESTCIVPTLDDVRQQLSPGDRLLVVADNCTDDTASVAAQAGAHVVCRNDTSRLGKGYALDFGIRHLQSDPPEVLVIIDADCRVAPGSIERLSTTASELKRPVQSKNLMLAPKNSPPEKRVAEFTWRIKNLIRPLGLSNLGLPCQMLGTGMAFPWTLTREVTFARGTLAEDVEIGLELARQRHPALFCPSAMVTSDFPSTREGTNSQRRRWEGGHLNIIKTAPRLIIKGVTSGDKNLLSLAVDICVPPLSLLAIAILLVTSAAVLLAICTLYTAPLAICAADLLVLLAALSLSWWVYGRDVIPAKHLYRLGAFFLSKFPIYLDLLVRRTSTQWTRTRRGGP